METERSGVQCTDRRILDLLKHHERSQPTGTYLIYLLEVLGPSDTLPTGQGSRHFYVGMTNDLSKRMAEHAFGRVKSTHHCRWQLVAVADCGSQYECALVERWLKTGKSRDKRQQFLSFWKQGKGICEIGLWLCRQAEAWSLRRTAQREIAGVM